MAIAKFSETVTAFMDAHSTSEPVTSAYTQDVQKPALFSNQLGFSNYLNILNTKVPGQPSKAVRVAFLVGESNFPSLLPALAQQAKVILLNDIDPLVRQHNRHLVRSIKQAESIEAFEKLYFDPKSNPALKAQLSLSSLTVSGNAGTFFQQIPTKVTLNNDILKSILNTQQFIFGQQHFLSSEPHFQATKRALEKCRILHTHLDLFAPKRIEQFMAALKEQTFEITVCNVSNLYEYDGPWKSQNRLFHCLDILLKTSPETTIFHSHTDKNKGHQALNSYAESSLDTFKQATEAHADALNQCKQKASRSLT